jgi:molybdenum cofactor cytidylyltransferase
VQPQSLQRVAAALAAHAVVLPSYAGQRGHPVGFGTVCRDALLALAGAEGAAGVVRAFGAGGGAHVLVLDDPGIVTDIDTVADLQAVERLLGS